MRELVLGHDWQFREGRGRTGKWEHGYPESWHWSRAGGDYFNERDFFSVHWEVYNPESTYGVRLHVESPRYSVDPLLNDLKQEVVAVLLAPAICAAVQQEGYIYRAGAKTSPNQMQRNKSTEAFRVVLTAEQRQPSHRRDIEIVHIALGSIVDEVLPGAVCCQIGQAVPIGGAGPAACSPAYSKRREASPWRNVQLHHRRKRYRQGSFVGLLCLLLLKILVLVAGMAIRSRSAPVPQLWSPGIRSGSPVHCWIASISISRSPVSNTRSYPMIGWASRRQPSARG